MIPITTCVKGKATESGVCHQLITTLDPPLTMEHNRLGNMHTTTAVLWNPVSSPSRTETDDEETANKDHSRCKSSLKRRHSCHRNSCKRSSSISSKLCKSGMDDVDSDLERRWLSYWRKRLRCQRLQRTRLLDNLSSKTPKIQGQFT